MTTGIALADQPALTKTNLQSGILFPATLADVWGGIGSNALYLGLVEGWLIRTGTADPANSDKVTGKPGLYIRTDTGKMWYHSGTDADAWVEIAATSAVQTVAAQILANDDTDVAANDYLRYTVNGVKGRSAAEARGDLFDGVVSSYQVIRRGSDGNYAGETTSYGVTSGNQFLRWGDVIMTWQVVNVSTGDQDTFETTVDYDVSVYPVRSLNVTLESNDTLAQYNVKVKSHTSSSCVLRFGKSHGNSKPSTVTAHLFIIGKATS